MKKIFSKSQKKDLAKILKGVLSRGLLPLFKVYAALLKKVDPYNHEIYTTLEELSQSAGYSPVEIQNIIEDLAMLKLISYKINKKLNQWNIKLLVR